MEESFEWRIDKENDFWELDFNRKIYCSYFGRCDGMKNQIAILSNGDVTTCCYDYNGSNSFGNLGNSDLRKILSSDKANHYRNNLRRGILPTKTCRMCFGTNSIRKCLLKQFYNFGQLLRIIPEKSLI